jgi:hypothetical protein
MTTAVDEVHAEHGVGTAAPPQRTLLPSGDQSHLSGFFSKLCTCPVNTFTQRLAGAYGRMSHARSVLSCAQGHKYVKLAA